VQNIHINFPLGQGELKSENIYIHMDLSGSEAKTHPIRNKLVNGNDIINSRSDDGPPLPSGKQVNGKQVNGKQVNGYPKLITSSPSWSNGVPKSKGTIYTSGLHHVPATASVSSS
jgi:hypothetical protein